MAIGLSGSGRRSRPLHVFGMALALVLAAFAGAGAGLVWQSSGFADEESEGGEQDSAEEQDAPGEAAGAEASAEQGDPTGEAESG